MAAISAISPELKLKAVGSDRHRKEIAVAGNFGQCIAFDLRPLIESTATAALHINCSFFDLFLVMLHPRAAGRYSRSAFQNAPPGRMNTRRNWRQEMIQEQIRSATIYQFPVGGRGGLRSLGDARRTTGLDVAMPRGSALAVGESWYHAEAIRDADKATT